MLSVAIITHNEEVNIKDALESVKWADEIVIVDSFSTDKTLGICRLYTDKIYSQEWAGYAEQKNKAVSLASHPWVLVLDADERVTKSLRDEILSIIRNTKDNENYPSPTPLPQGEGARGRVDGYYIPRKNFFLGRWIRHGGWWPDYALRLFRKEKGFFEDREVHESVKLNGETGYLNNPVEHYTYRDIEDYIKRMNTYSTLAARELFKKDRGAGIFDLTLRPLFTFFKMYLLRLGFLDGLYGLILAVLYSVYTFSKYIKLWEMQKTKGRY
ncbi:MAG: glycosyltransferase family 2 protein [Nitrospirae bacterium]|nr:glycosyltransferase family 2 protein [Nitrospirota bacterium]